MPIPPLPEPSRRRLLGRASQTAAAAAAVTLIGPTAAIAAPPLAEPITSGPALPKGYHETEHTRRYYRLARY
ncbi:MAG: hypothetical protein JWP22_464 [Ramlibacter sp.]|nr:hypothetical protein [Ramlibacter sp.]